ncbi:MAG: DUF559 domain-containing protein, partial [Actinomycetota bacterium]
DAGLSAEAIQRRIAGGTFERLYRGVYRMAGAQPSWEQDLFAAQEWARPAVVSHRSAAELWRLDGIAKGHVDLLTTGNSRRRPGVIVRRTRSLGRNDWRWRTPFRVTTPERTLRDLAAIVNESELECALESALRLGLTTIERVLGKLNEHPRHGREGCGVLRGLLIERCRHLVPNDSTLETLWERLARRGELPPYERQFRIWDGDHYLGRVDFAWSHARVAVETDSWKWHFGREAWEQDQRKNNYLQKHGWIVLRFTWRQIVETPDEVIASIWAVLTPRLPLV